MILKNLTLKELYVLQDIIDKRLLLEYDVEQAEKEYNDLTHEIESYIFWHPHWLAVPLSVVLAVRYSWQNGLLPTWSDIADVTLNEWLILLIEVIAFGAVYMLAICIASMMVSMLVSITFKKGPFSYEARRKKQKIFTVKSKLCLR